MIDYLLHSDIDKMKWDACIQKAFNGNIYALSWYLDVVHEGWEALVEDDYVRVMPLTGNKSMVFITCFNLFLSSNSAYFYRNS